jgi:hypothetical protein
LALKNRFHSRQKLASGIRFDYIAARTYVEDLFYDVPTTIFAKEQEFGLLRVLPDLPSRFDPIKCWQPNIQQDYELLAVRPMLRL